MDGVLGPLERGFKLLLTDGSKTIASRASDEIKSGASVERVQEIVSKAVSQHLENVKRKIADAIEESQ